MTSTATGSAGARDHFARQPEAEARAASWRRGSSADRLGHFVAEGEDLVAAALDGGWAVGFALVDAERPPELSLRAEPVVVASARGGLPSRASAPGVGVFRRRPARSGSCRRSGWRSGTSATRATSARSLRPPTAFGAYLALSPGCADPYRPQGAAGVDGLDLPRAPGRLRRRRGPSRSSRATRRRSPGLMVARPLRPRLRTGGAARREVEACAASGDDPARGHAESLNVAMAGTIALYDWRRSLEAR